MTALLALLNVILCQPITFGILKIVDIARFAMTTWYLTLITLYVISGQEIAQKIPNGSKVKPVQNAEAAQSNLNNAQTTNTCVADPFATHKW
jgi:hypothetical protein